MKVYEIISENSTNRNIFELREKVLTWITDLVAVIRRGGTEAMVARKQLIEKLTDKYAGELAVARKNGLPDPQVYAALKKELEAAGLAGKELKSVLDEVVVGAEKIYAKSPVAKDVAINSPARAAAIEKAAMASKQATSWAAQQIAGIPKPIFALLQTAGCVVAVRAYYTRIAYLEEEYNKYLANPNEGNIYREAPNKQKAYEWYRKGCDKALGQLELELAAILTPFALAGLIKNLTGFLAFWPVIGWPVKAARGIIRTLLDAANWVAKKGGVNVTVKDIEQAGFAGLGGILTWMHTTEDGAEFFRRGMLGAITAGIGSVSRDYITLAAEAAEKYKGPGAAWIVNPIGKAIAGTNAGGGGPQAPAPSPEDEKDKAEQERNANLPRYLRVVTKGKVKYLNNVQITDQDGYLLSGLDKTMADTEYLAKQHGVPNPFDGIPKNPNTRYGVGKLY
jgi:hypothetical protein